MLCDRVGVIVGGKLRGVGSPEEIVGMKAQGMEILFELSAPGAQVAALAAKAMRTGDRYRLNTSQEELFGALEQVKAAGGRVLSVTEVKPSLEEYFMHLVEADRAQGAAVEVYGK
jgi:ABC-2 type transport system ATP-binding protein